MPSLRRLAAAALLLLPALAAAPAHADAAAVRARRDAALAAVASDEDAAPRAKTLGDLAAIDDLDAARALAEVVAALGGRLAQVEAAHAKTKKTYEPYATFSLSDPKDWETKKRLLALLEEEDDTLQALGLLAHVAETSIAKLKHEAGLRELDRASAAETNPHARAVLLAGLVGNPAAKSVEAAKRAVKDEAPLVRIAALRAMELRKDAAFVEPASKALADPGWPLRKAAIHALAATGDLRAVLPLVGAMQTEDGALLDDFAAALTALTGEKLGHHADSWRKWCEDHKEELAAGGKVAALGPRVAKMKVSVPVDYYGLQIVSKRVLFVIDVSGSMKEPIGTEPLEQTGVSRKDQPFSGPKIEVAKRILGDAVRKLDPSTSFNIVFFNHTVNTFQDTMVLATPDVKGKADLAIAELQPVGATYAYGALRRSFEFAGISGAPVSGKFDPQVDTIFFLSDGAPTDDGVDNAKLVPAEPILEAVREWNRVANVRIHTIAIDPRIGGGAMIRFMKSLAAQNGGTYTPIGAK